MYVGLVALCSNIRCYCDDQRNVLYIFISINFISTLFWPYGPCDPYGFQKNSTHTLVQAVCTLNHVTVLSNGLSHVFMCFMSPSLGSNKWKIWSHTSSVILDFELTSLYFLFYLERTLLGRNWSLRQFFHLSTLSEKIWSSHNLTHVSYNILKE